MENENESFPDLYICTAFRVVKMDCQYIVTEEVNWKWIEFKLLRSSFSKGLDSWLE